MDDQISLVFVPEPFLDESPASWLMRVCEYHQSWPNQLFHVFGLVNVRDIDLDLNSVSLRKLCRGTTICFDKLDFLARKFEKLRIKEYAEAYLLPREGPIFGCYRYCPECLKNDKTPYWRLTWRMSHVRVCVQHQCRLATQCANCELSIGVLLTQPKQLADQKIKNWCKYCSNCGAVLENGFSPRVDSVEAITRVDQLQRTITASLLHGYFRIDGLSEPLPLDHLPRALLAGATPKSTCQSSTANIVADEIKGYLSGKFGIDTLTKSNVRCRKVTSIKNSKRKSGLVKDSPNNSKLKYWMNVATNLRIEFFLNGQKSRTGCANIRDLWLTYPE